MGIFNNNKSFFKISVFDQCFFFNENNVIIKIHIFILKTILIVGHSAKKSLKLV